MLQAASEGTALYRDLGSVGMGVGSEQTTKVAHVISPRSRSTLDDS